MSRQLEQKSEDRARKAKDTVLLAVYGGMFDQVGRAGGELQGLSFKFKPVETLMVIKAHFPGGMMIAFVGSEDMVGCLIKGMRLAGRDELQWRADKWG